MDQNDFKRQLIAKLETPVVTQLLDDISPAGYGATFFIGTLKVAFQENPKLLQCSAASLIRVCYLAAKLALPIGEGGVYIQPRKVGGQQTAVPVIDYRAMIEMALEHPKVHAVHAGTVREGDEFKNNIGNMREPIFHAINVMAKRGELIGAWCQVGMEGGHIVSTVMTKDDVLDVRPEYYQKTPWGNKKTEAEMWRKSAFRRGMKTMPRSPRLRLAMAAEDAVDMETAIPAKLPQALVDELSGPRAPGAAPSGAKPAAAETRTPHPADNRSRQDDPLPTKPHHAEPMRNDSARRIEEGQRLLDEKESNPAPMRGGQPAQPVRSVKCPNCNDWGYPDGCFDCGTVDDRKSPENEKPIPNNPPAPEQSGQMVAAAVGELMEKLDAEAIKDPEIGKRWRKALEDHAGGSLGQVKSMTQVNALQIAVFGR